MLKLLTLENLGWLFVLAVLALGVIPFRIGRYLRESKFKLMDLAFVVLFVAIVALWLSG